MGGLGTASTVTEGVGEARVGVEPPRAGLVGGDDRGGPGGDARGGERPAVHPAANAAMTTRTTTLRAISPTRPAQVGAQGDVDKALHQRGVGVTGAVQSFPSTRGEEKQMQRWGIRVIAGVLGISLCVTASACRRRGDQPAARPSIKPVATTGPSPQINPSPTSPQPTV